MYILYLWVLIFYLFITHIFYNISIDELVVIIYNLLSLIICKYDLTIYGLNIFFIGNYFTQLVIVEPGQLGLVDHTELNSATLPWY